MEATVKDTRPKQLYNRRSQNEIKDGGRKAGRTIRGGSDHFSVAFSDIYRLVLLGKLTSGTL